MFLRAEEPKHMFWRCVYVFVCSGILISQLASVNRLTNMPGGACEAYLLHVAQKFPALFIYFHFFLILREHFSKTCLKSLIFVCNVPKDLKNATNAFSRF